MEGRKRKKPSSSTTPKHHNHGHNYNTRFKRHYCCFCSSNQGSRGESQQNACSLVACAYSITMLPDDLILDILLLMPAKLLYEVLRFVCLGWRNLIASPSFTSTHLLMSSATTNGVLYEDKAYPHLAFHTETQTNSNGDYEIVHTSFRKPPFWCKIVSSYRGLVLLHDLANLQLFHVANLVTRTKVSLPPLRIRFTQTCVIALSYASSVDRYKVFLVGYAKPFDKKGDVLERPKVFAYTVGVDQSWRIVDVQGIPVCKTVRDVFSHRPFTIRGIIYWINLFHNYGFAMDVNTEMFHQFPLFVGPYSSLRDLNRLGDCISLNTGLGFIRYCKVENRTVTWALYELTDVKSSEWTKVRDIDIRVLLSKLEEYLCCGTYTLLRPFLYMRNGDLWFELSIDGSSSTSALYCCSLDKGDRVHVAMKQGADSVILYPHFNTLLTLKNLC